MQHFNKPAAAICLAVASAFVQAQQATYDFNIPAQPAGQVLDALAKQTGLQPFYAEGAVKGARSPGVKGRLSLREALDKALAGTGLTYQFTGEKAVAIKAVPAEKVAELAAIEVKGSPIQAVFGTALSGEALNTHRFATNDAATLLDGTPGISFYTGGGVSSLPVINGLADDRLKITVDGMTITSACPNHMNPALSYINPAALSQVNVYAGIVPVSQGGDSIGGAIAVKSVPPTFADPGQGTKTSGSVAAFTRSNGNVTGLSARASVATENFSIGYVGNTVDAGNYKDGNGKDVPASRYKVRNNAVNLAGKAGTDVFTLSIGWQDIPYQGFPNQSMDMTSNKSLSFNAGYNGLFDWGSLEARAFRQRVRHKMDVLEDKAQALGWPPASSYMPMDTKAVDLGYSIVATAPLNESNMVRFGHEFHRYTLDDWWPPLVGTGMGPDTFWNVNGGKRDRVALFAELDTKVNQKLSTQVGARVERVTMNTGNVQGYFNASNYPAGDPWMLMGGDPNSVYANDADAFNARNHKKTDLNWDLTASARYVENERATYDIGFARKTRSPNLHERYTWSNEAMMAGLMNNWFGDLNSYVGDLDLKPEVAYTLKLSADWHDAEERDWQLKVAPLGVSEFLCVRRRGTFPRCCLPKVPLDRRRAARWGSRWSFYPRLASNLSA